MIDGDTMKKLVFIICLIIFVPYFIISFFIADEKGEFHYSNNMIVKVKRESLGTIDEVPFEEYILGVLAGEMPVSFEMEALKAQAVAARSYVLKKMQANNTESYDVVDTIANQVYCDLDMLKTKWGNNFESNYAKLKQVIDETYGEYLSYNGEIVNAMFFSTSSGTTENSEEIFVSGGSIGQIKINEKIFTGRELSNLLKLRSSNFEISKNENNVIITSKGYGHGVGMSQYGALGMAREGYKYSDILKHYYSNVEIKKI